MTACRDVKKWITEKVQVPVQRAIKKAKEKCDEYKKKVEEKVNKKIEEWVSKRVKKCKKKKCKKWCLCCNKWFCWFETLVEKIVTWVVQVIIKWVPYLVCKIVMEVVDIVTEFVIKLVKTLVTIVVCLFTEPLQALVAIWDLWMDILNQIDKIIDFVLGLLDDVIGILRDIGRLLDALADSFGVFGTWLFGLLSGVLNVIIKAVDIVRGLIDAIMDIWLGILSLNWCKISAGLTNLGVQVGLVILLVFSAFFGITIGGPRRGFSIKYLQEMILSTLESAFGDDQERIDRSVDRIRLYSRPLGLPMKVDARRMCIRSGEFLWGLHKDGLIDLHAIAGNFSGCEGGWATSNHQINGEVVYTDTDITVTPSDIRLFITEGPNAVPSFTVYPIKLNEYKRILEASKVKAYEVGVELFWDAQIRDYEIVDDTFMPSQAPNDEEIFAPFGRVGMGDDLSTIPALAVFFYDDDTTNGYTTAFRPPSYSNPCKEANPNGSDTAYSKKSGVTFLERVPQWAFQYVLVHEMGHYLGLCHENHPGMEFIMFTPSDTNPQPRITGATVLEFLLLGHAPYFTQTDAREVWKWLTEVADDTCLP